MSENQILVDGIKIEEPVENYTQLIEKIEKLNQNEISFDVFYFIKDNNERNFISNDKDFSNFIKESTESKTGWKLYTKANNYTNRPPSTLEEHYKQLINYQIKESLERIKKRLIIDQDLGDPNRVKFSCPNCKKEKILAFSYKCVICDNEPFCKGCCIAHEKSHPTMKIPLKIES